jgi:thiamine transport system permease protein
VSLRRGLPVALAALPVVFVVALVVWPLVAVTNRAVRPGGVWDPGALAGVAGDATVWSAVWFSVWQAALSTVVTVVVALPAAWLFARVRFAGRGVLWAALVVPFVLPTVVVAAAVVSVAGPSVTGRGAVWAVVVAHVFFNYAVVVRVVGVAWASVGRAPAEAATMLGASPLRAWWSVTMPMLAPSVLAAASVVYLFSFTSFGVVLVLGASRLRTVEVEIYERIRTLDLAAAATLALAQLLVVGVLLVVAARWSQRLTVASVPAGDTARPTGGLGTRVAVGCVLASMAALFVVPLGALVVRSVWSTAGWTLDYWQGLGESRGVLFASPLEALGNSLVIAAAATVVALVIGGLAVAAVVVAERRRHRPGRTTAAFDALLMLPLGASAVTVGLGLLLAFDRPPLDLRGTATLVVAAQALVAVPFVVRVMLPAVRSIDTRVRDAATMLGASPWRVLTAVELPLLARPVAVAAGFAFAMALGEFGATLVVARPDLPTLPVTLGRLLGQPGDVNRGQAMAVATLLMVVTAAGVLVADRARVPRRRSGAPPPGDAPVSADLVSVGAQ